MLQYGGGGDIDKVSFWNRRLYKIIPPLFIVIWGLSILKLYVKGYSWPWAEVLLNSLGLISTIGRVTWYITYQYFCYLVFTIIGVKGSKKNVPAYFLSSILVLLFAVNCNIPSVGTSMWGLNAFSFQIGVVCAIYNDAVFSWIDSSTLKMKCICLMCVCALFAVLFITCYFLLNNPAVPCISYPMKSVISAITCLGCLYIMFWKSAKYRGPDFVGVGFEKIGKVSYELLLIHGIMIYHFPEFFSGNVVLDLILFLLISFPLSELLHILVRAPA